MARAGSEPPATDAAADAPTATSASATFGKYKPFASLGRGGMADVFLAVSRGPLGFNKLVVLKCLRTALAEDPSFRAMFLDEARLAARLNHPNIVHTYEVGEHDGSFFIAMEYLEGQPLNRVIKDLAKSGESFDEVLCARIVADALAGLQHAHALRDYDGRPLEIVHRDVSPHNVFVTYDGQAKLVDFGIAKAALSSTVTEVGVLKGKVAYMAPEQAMGAPVDRRADVFGMGIVLWELLARRRLFIGDTAAATMHRLLNDPVPRIATVRDVDPGLDAIVARALEKEADNRYQSAQEMRDALEEWIRSTGRKVRHADIGARLAAMYGDDWSEVKRQIQEQMLLASTPSSDHVPAAAPVDARRAAKLPRIGRASLSDTERPDSEPPPASEPPEELHRLGGVAFFVVLLLLLFGGVAFLLVKVAFGPVEAPAASATPSATTGATTTPSAIATPTERPTPTPTEPPTATEPPSATPPAAAPPRPSTAPARPAAHDDAAPGFLTFDTYPWTRVSEGGRVLGTTPLIKVPLPPGPHTLLLENADEGISKTYSVTIKSGETFATRLGLSR